MVGKQSGFNRRKNSLSLMKIPPGLFHRWRWNHSQSQGYPPWGRMRDRWTSITIQIQGDWRFTWIWVENTARVVQLTTEYLKIKITHPQAYAAISTVSPYKQTLQCIPFDLSFSCEAWTWRAVGDPNFKSRSIRIWHLLTPTSKIQLA